MSRIVGVAYVPVLHKGYIDFFNELSKQGVAELYIVSDEVLESHTELDYINRKDRIRALPSASIVAAISSMRSFRMEILDSKTIEELQKEEVGIMMPNEDISHFIATTYFPQKNIEYCDIFLRWNKDNIGEDVVPLHQETVQLSDLEQKIFGEVISESTKSFDWWRQVGAALVKDGEVIVVTHNEHMPEAQMPNILGDTRALFKKGVHINYVTSAHAEVAAIGEAARRGVSTEGAELYVTDFPCPYCARLIVKAGIKKVLFSKGYAVLEGDVFLKEAGVELVFVDIKKGQE
ncbi:hypothetical protein K2X96_02230 [Patescibacteria group bacterium]|nr:hypothetical protein [Patescibacteria group bacterium]